MRKFWTLLLALALATGAIATQGIAQEKKEKKEKMAAAGKEIRWSGFIQRTSKEQSTITVRKGDISRTIYYDSSTKWTKGRKSEPAEMSEFKDGSRVIVFAKEDDQKRLMATNINLRAQ